MNAQNSQQQAQAPQSAAMRMPAAPAPVTKVANVPAHSANDEVAKVAQLGYN